MQNGAAGEIDAGSVGRLTLRMAFPTGQRGGHAGAPVVDGDRLFMLTPFPHSILAFDLARPDAPVLWRYARRADGAARGLATRNITTTGIALSAGRLFLNTFDGHTIALDAATGDVPGRCNSRDDQGQSLLGAPIVAGDRVFIGSNGGDFGVRGWVAALETSSGRVLWRRYNAGPDVDVGVGKDFGSQYLPRRTSAFRVGHPMHGSKAVAISPARQTTMRGVACWSMPPDIRLPGMLNSDRGRTISRQVCSPGMPSPGRRAGSSRSIRTTCTGWALKAH